MIDLHLLGTGNENPESLLRSQSQSQRCLHGEGPDRE